MEKNDKIQSLLKDFFDISGIRVCIYNTEFKEVYCYPPEISSFCSHIQSIPQMRKKCLESDADAFLVVKQTNEPYIYKCKCGLYEAVAPIYNFGKLTGYMMLGQIRDNDIEALSATLSRLENFGINKAVLKKAYDQIICLDYQKLNSYINIMTVLAEHFTRNNKLKSTQETLPALIYKEIQNNHSKELTLNKLAEKFSCSVSTLTGAYKKEYGISIHQFIINTRLKHATDLLESTDKAIKEISEECGFYDQNHFYRTFKNFYKISPSEYKEKYIKQ